MAPDGIAVAKDGCGTAPAPSVGEAGGTDEKPDGMADDGVPPSTDDVREDGAEVASEGAEVAGIPPPEPESDAAALLKLDAPLGMAGTDRPAGEAAPVPPGTTV